MPTTPLSRLLKQLHDDYEELHPPASVSALTRLRKCAGGELPEDVLTLYRDHDGSDHAPGSADGDRILPVRLLPISEALEANESLAEALGEQQMPGRPLWLWTDDNSNYVGLYLDGPLEGWLTVLEHDEPRCTPAFRSVHSFLERVLGSDEDEEIDIPSLVRELPASGKAPKTDAADRKLAMQFLERYRAETDVEAKRTWGMTFLSLLPFADTGLAVELLRDPDMWTPEAAAALLKLRRYTGAISELEWLAREGKANGDGAAIQALVHLGTPEATAALERLEKVLKGNKRSLLKTYRGGPARPAKR